MEAFEQLHGLPIEKKDASCPVRKAAFLFLDPSTHLDERYLQLLLDWLEHKVALIPFIQVENESDGDPQVFYVPEANLISERAVIFIKLLNIEKQGPTRTALNHFNRVGGQHPVGFFEDLISDQIVSDLPNERVESPGRVSKVVDIGGSAEEVGVMSPVSGHARTPLSASGQQTESWASSRIALQSIPKVVDNLVAQGPSQIVTTSPAPTTKSGPDVEVTLPDPPAPLDCCNADKWGNSAQSRQINSVRFPAIANQSSPEQLQVPDSILEAETLLNQKFDLAMHWGPSCSLTRAERLERGRRLGLASQKWNWVSTVLDKYPELAKLKSDQRIQVLQQQHVPMLAAPDSSIGVCTN